MGSPLSPILAEIVMQDLEQLAIENLLVELLFYFWYVDDIILTAPVENINKILNISNSYYERLQFTMEVDSERRLSFLDILIIEDQKFVFDIRKQLLDINI